jgi:PIN domain nuclease of toxin-antitoxin system
LHEHTPPARAAAGFRSIAAVQLGQGRVAEVAVDRMLVCQAIVHGLAIVTPDALVNQYPARVVW